MLTVKQAKRLNIFSDVIAIIVTLSIFLPFILGMPAMSLTAIGYALLVLLIASWVIKVFVHKDAKDPNLAAQFWASVFGGMAIAYFLFW